MKVMDFSKKVFSGKQEKAREAPAKRARKAAKAPSTARKPVTRKRKELDFFKFTSTDPTRLFMNGVYHDKGFKVATDGQFPLYERVIPDFSKMVKVEADFKALKASPKEAEPLMRIQRKLTRKAVIRCMLPTGHVVADVNLKKILHFVEYYPESQMYVFEDTNKVLAFVQGGVESPEAMLLVMPMVADNPKDFTSCPVSSISPMWEKVDYDLDDLLINIKKKDILERRKYGTLTEKDLEQIKVCEKFLQAARADKQAA